MDCDEEVARTLEKSSRSVRSKQGIEEVLIV